MFTKMKLDSEQFDRLFTALGYRLQGNIPGPNRLHRVYVNPDYDAMQVMPPTGQERIDHLVTLRIVSVGKGIVDDEEFDRLLDQVSQPAVPATQVVAHA